MLSPQNNIPRIFNFPTPPKMEKFPLKTEVRSDGKKHAFQADEATHRQKQVKRDRVKKEIKIRLFENKNTPKNSFGAFLDNY